MLEIVSELAGSVGVPVGYSIFPPLHTVTTHEAMIELNFSRKLRSIVQSLITSVRVDQMK
jgi:hypothetical protein